MQERKKVHLIHEKREILRHRDDPRNDSQLIMCQLTISHFFINKLDHACISMNFKIKTCHV